MNREFLPLFDQRVLAAKWFNIIANLTIIGWSTRLWFQTFGIVDTTWQKLQNIYNKHLFQLGWLKLQTTQTK